MVLWAIGAGTGADTARCSEQIYSFIIYVSRLIGCLFDNPYKPKILTNRSYELHLEGRAQALPASFAFLKIENVLTFRV